MSYQDLIITKLAWGLNYLENIKWFISRVGVRKDVGFFIYQELPNAVLKSSREGVIISHSGAHKVFFIS